MNATLKPPEPEFLPDHLLILVVLYLAIQTCMFLSWFAEAARGLP